MTATTDTENGEERIDQELACLHGHAEARDRLKQLGRSDEWVDRVESVCDGYVDFARLVVECERYAEQD